MTDARVQNPGMENSRSVILDPKENFLVLDDLQRDPMIEPLEPGLAGAGARIITINGQQHLVTTPGDTGARPLPRITSQFLPGEQRYTAPLIITVNGQHCSLLQNIHHHRADPA